MFKKMAINCFGAVNIIERPIYVMSEVINQSNIQGIEQNKGWIGHDRFNLVTVDHINIYTHPHKLLMPMLYYVNTHGLYYEALFERVKAMFDTLPAAANARYFFDRDSLEGFMLTQYKTAKIRHAQLLDNDNSIPLTFEVK